MRTKEYNKYIEKRNLSLAKLNILNVDEIILERLKSHKINIRNKNIVYIVNMVKKVLLDYEMFGKEKTLEMIDEDDIHIYRGVNNNMDENLKVNNYLKKLKLPFANIDNSIFREYIVMIANEVSFIMQEEKKLKLVLN